MLSHSYIAELQHEIISTRKMLERIPQNMMDWKPHEKSMSLGQLASHIAEIPGYIQNVLTTEGLDFNPETYNPFVSSEGSEIVRVFDEKVSEALQLLQQADDATMQQNWTLSGNGQVVFTLPRVASLRGFVMNHWIHHRGQLSVYLRLLNVSVPSIYGPSADELVAA